jgi:predicted lipoprotein with Yx(FWY)xxD motif
MITSHDMRKVPNRRRWALLVVPAGVAGLAALAACGSSGTSGTASGASTPSPSTSAAVASVGLKTAKVGSVTVLTNSKGFTLYSFAPDTSTKSVCNGACAASWPPAKAPANASAVKAPFATIKRSGGSTQLTFHGHPLYTFVGDKAPGQASGNGVNAFGGLWHEAPASGSAAPTGSSSSGSGGGYGY